MLYSSTPILRLGLRYVRGLRKGSADALVRARAAGTFSSIEDLTLRVPELSKGEWTMLAQIGALNGLGNRFHRRDALWQVERAVRPAGVLFKQSQQEDAPSPLSQMTDEERLVTDFHGTGLTVGRHPMAHRRAEWDGMNIRRACDLKTIADGRFARIAGCVIARQRPGTARGFLFLSLEDETGIANAIVTPDVYERNRILLTSGKFLMIEGILQNQDNVISVKARRIHSLSVTAAETESHDFH
jgi:error-prone DNA polymerase